MEALPYTFTLPVFAFRCHGITVHRDIISTIANRLVVSCRLHVGRDNHAERIGRRQGDI